MQSKLPILDYESRAGRRSALPALIISLVIAATMCFLLVDAQRRAYERSKAWRGSSPSAFAISGLRTALAAFEVDNGRYPTSTEGLNALVSRPPGLEQTWLGPYIKSVPVDQWGSAYRYSIPDPKDSPSYDLHSVGPDGIDGTADDVSIFSR